MEFNEKDLLNYALENGIINIGTIQMQVEMNNRQKYLKEHPYSVWLGKDGFWHSYLPNADGRQAIKKKTKEDLEEKIVAYYIEKKATEHSFKERWNAWIERQQVCGRADNTICKYQSDYNRFFKGYEIEEMSVKLIDEEIIGKFINQLLNDKAISKKALKAMFGYMNGVFEKSIKDKVVRENPCILVDLPVYFKDCMETKRDESRRVLCKSESETIINNIRDKQREELEDVLDYLIELSFCTGMRVGEIAGLKWSDIDYENKVINITRSEKHNRKTKEFYLSTTKNKKIRQFPLTEQIELILAGLKKLQEKNQCLGEFIACDTSGKINVNNLSKYGSRRTKTDKCKQGYSMHAARRTLNSNLRCNGVSAITAAALLGHSEKVNEGNYTEDVTTFDEKFKLVSMASLM